jgi:pimeloyl-ACP methyl ester carboxylesterase
MASRDWDRSAICLRDHINAVVELVDTLDGDIVLIGHSGGGAVAHGAVDVRPDGVTRVVYVDSGPLGSGDVINDELPAEASEVPLPNWSFFDDADLVDMNEQLRDEFRDRAIPTPAGVARDPQLLTDDRRYDVPVTIITCQMPSEQLRQWVEEGQPFVKELAAVKQVDYIDLPTGHWPQFTRPDDLARAILEAIG